MCLTLSSWVLGNFGLFLFALAALIITLQLSSRQHVSIAEIFYRWIALLPLGCTGIYAFVIHAFFPAISALTIGWPASLFQFEVALANLSFGILGILSFKASYGFRLATVIGATLAMGRCRSAYQSNGRTPKLHEWQRRLLVLDGFTRTLNFAYMHRSHKAQSPRINLILHKNSEIEPYFL
jgi:hypothetical protein